jgi:hypothetical protein
LRLGIRGERSIAGTVLEEELLELEEELVPPLELEEDELLEEEDELEALLELEEEDELELSEELDEGALLEEEWLEVPALEESLEVDDEADLEAEDELWEELPFELELVFDELERLRLEEAPSCPPKTPLAQIGEVPAKVPTTATTGRITPKAKRSRSFFFLASGVKGVSVSKNKRRR